MKVVAGSGHLANAMCDEPARNALGRGQRLPLFVEQLHDDILKLLGSGSEDEVAEPLANGPFHRLDLFLRISQRFGPCENPQRDHGIADGDADFGNVPAAGEVEQAFLDERFPRSESVDLPLDEYAAAEPGFE